MSKEVMISLPKGEAAVLGAILANQAAIMAALAYLPQVPPFFQQDLDARARKSHEIARTLNGK